MHEPRDTITLDKLAPFLEGARTGSRKLDMIVAYVLAGMSAETRRRVELLLDGRFSWGVVSDLFPDEAPDFTTSLDAAVPGENVVFAMFEAERHRWVAIHRTQEGEEIVARGASEALARRGAGLKALAAAAAAGKAAAPEAPVEVAAPAHEPADEPAVAPPGEPAAEDVAEIAAEIAVESEPYERPQPEPPQPEPPQSEPPQPEPVADERALAMAGGESATGADGDAPGDGAAEPADDAWRVSF